MDKRIQIVLGVHDKTGDYSKHAGVTISSVLRNTMADVTVHIFHDDTLTEENKFNFTSLIHAYKQIVRFHSIRWEDNIKDIKEIERLLPDIERLSPGALFRLMICKVLKNVEKAIYLDSDIICNLDIKELWNEDLQGCPIGCVLDSGVQAGHGNILFEGLPDGLLNPRTYVNTGVIVFDIPRVNKKCDLLKNSLDFLHKYPFAHGLDQAAINYLFQKDCAYLNEKYNFFPRYYSAKNLSNLIYHFAGERKPWVCIKQNEIYKEYWNLLSSSPWGNKQVLLDNLFNTSRYLEEVLAEYPILSRKKFILAFIRRFFVEIKRKYIL